MDVTNPKHYKEHPSGVECIQVTEHMNFCLGNAIKYIWRVGLKGDAVSDLEKAAWYINREIERIKDESVSSNEPGDGEDRTQIMESDNSIGVWIADWANSCTEKLHNGRSIMPPDPVGPVCSHVWPAG